MAINFPSSPVNGQIFTDGDKTWVYSSSTGAWKLQTQILNAAQLEINAQSGTTYTFALADAGKLVTFSNTNAISLTVPTNTNVAFPIGTQINIAQINIGRVTIAGDTGVTVNSSLGLKTRTQYSVITCVKTGTDTWLITGDSSVA
jgi:hypothetical protein